MPNEFMRVGHARSGTSVSGPLVHVELSSTQSKSVMPLGKPFRNILSVLWALASVTRVLKKNNGRHLLKKKIQSCSCNAEGSESRLSEIENRVNFVEGVL